MNNKETLQSEAWRRMYLLRNCPSPGLLVKGGELAERHLKSCSFCRAIMEHLPQFTMAGQILAKMPAKRSEMDPVKPGEIRRVRPLTGPEDWFDSEGKYHNPPLVLILTDPDELGFVEVSQVFEEPDLAGVGDTLLDDAGKFIAEGWNSYGLPENAFFSTPYAMVDEDALEQARLQSRTAVPEQDATTPRYFFHLNEIDTGSFFSYPANMEALSRQEEKLYEDILPEKSDTLQWMLANWDKHIQPLAAAAAYAASNPLAGMRGAESRRLPILAARYEDGAIGEPSTIEANLTICKGKTGTLCALSFTVDPDENVLDVKASHKNQEAESVSHEKMDDGAVRVTAVFREDVTDPRDVRFLVILEAK